MMGLLRNKANSLLWFVWMSWLLALFCYVFEWKWETLLSVATLSLTFGLTLYFNKKGFSMFRKKSSEAAEAVEKSPTVPVAAANLSVPVESVQVTPEGRRCTIVAQNSVFSGNTEIEGDIQVYGKMKGHINLKEGILYVMRDGFIEGEFTAPGIVINGRVQGTCISENIEIHEHGVMEGISRSVALSIRPGGSFIGQAERLVVEAKDPEAERVVKIKKTQPEKPAELTTGSSQSLNK